MPTLANRNNNPGNLRFIGQEGASQGEGGFAKFSDAGSGYAAMMNDLEAKMTGKNSHGLGPNSSLVDMVNVYAPSKDSNDPGGYAAVVANKLGVSPASKLSELQPRIGELAEAMAEHEGYKGQKSAKGFNPNPFSNPTGSATAGGVDFSGLTAPTNDTTPINKDSLGNDLLNRTNDAAEAIKSGMSGQINPLSSVIQTGGAIAGGVGDVVNRGLEMIPGFKKVEELLGQGAGMLANTEIGKSVGQSIQDFSKAHPELAADIGAGFNIATAIPIFRGLAALKSTVLDGTANALKGLAEKGASKEMTEVLSRNKTGLKLLQSNPDVVETLVKERAIPEIVSQNGVDRYSIDEASKLLDHKISSIEDGELQPLLQQGNSPLVSSRASLAQYKQEAMKMAEQELKDPGPIGKYFDRIQNVYGDFPTIGQLNEAKRLVAKNISEAGFASPTYTTDKIVRSALQKSVEDGANALGLGDVQAINQKMAKLIKAQNALDTFNNTKVKSSSGLLHSLIRQVPGGETALKIKNLASPTGLLKNIQGEVLKRTTPGYVKTSVGKTVRKVGGLISSAMANKANK